MATPKKSIQSDAIQQKLDGIADKWLRIRAATIKSSRRGVTTNEAWNLAVEQFQDTLYCKLIKSVQVALDNDKVTVEQLLTIREILK